MNLRTLRLLLPALLLSACATAPPPAPEPVVPPPPAPPPKIALVLGGGAARGFAHIGVIKMLDALEIKPDLIVGTSAGSIAGALYAAGYDGFALQEMAFDLDRSMVSDWSLFNRGLIKGQALEDYINRAVGGKGIEQLKKPFACVATELRSGLGVLFQRGNVGTAVRASSAVPGVFEPVPISGKDYVDGGLVAPVPIRYARQLGADFVIAVDVASPPGAEEADSKLAVLLKTFTIMGQSIREAELPLADVVIAPKLDQIASSDFEGKHRAILAGERAALAAVPIIREKLRARMVPAAPSAAAMPTPQTAR
ncbi:MAG TPA: patatin-like phospholipase family protein [Solimonas sp.]|nr:patatin-like phospholipase family protein [Solimonas sp.]